MRAHRAEAGAFDPEASYPLDLRFRSFAIDQTGSMADMTAIGRRQA